mmetsp:Transcript_44718/g.50659  ORF Transcript_44718/g.50659 Transcript_44718/m.50659 type:complete len:532 (+) Transcript_44718:111-1706(+)
MTLSSNKLAFALFVLCATVLVVKAVEDKAGYVNPCNEFDTATVLNELYYNTPTGNSSDDDYTARPSYYDSGFFIHGEDPGGGTNDVYIPMTPGKFIGLPTANSTFLIGSDNLLAPVCPVDVTTDGEYPWYCPTPLSIDAGAISFSYIRADIQPPVSILNEYLKTGVDPYTNSNNTPTPGTWPGPGYIISPQFVNPEIPIDDSHKYTFWDNNRVGNSWSTDGSSWSRIDCGNGISVQELLLGNDNIPFNDAGPAVDPETDVIMQCSPPTVEWENYASKPKGWDENNYCPDETYADYQTYNEYNYNKVSTYMSSMTLTLDDCTLDFFSNQTGDFNNKFGQCYVLTASQSLMCGIPPSKFDSVYIPAQKYENWPKEREELAAEFVGYATNNRETSVRPWNGVGFNEFGQHLVFYANYDDDDSVQEALGYANDFYEKSQLNGGSPIRIPVVIMNTENMWLQDDADDNNKNGSQSPPFTCPSTSTTSATTTSSSANSNSTVGVDDEDFASSANFLVGSISTLLSSVFIVAVVLYSC